MIDHKKNDNRKIRIEPNPFRQMKQKFRMKSQKMNNGVPVVNTSGKPIMTEIEPEALHRVPGTSKRVAPMRGVYGLETGLTHLMPNPYADLESYSPEWEIVLKKKEKVLLQHLLEYECGFPFDYLTHRIPEGAVESNKMDKKFFEKLESKPLLDGNVTFLDLSNPVHRVNYYTLLAHKSVANTWEDLLDGGNESAEWYIVDEEAKQQREKSKAQIDVEGGAALYELNSSNSDALIQMAKALELGDANNRNLTKDKAYNMIYSYYTGSKSNFDNFMEMFKLWKDPVVGRNKFIALAELYDYQHQGLVTYKNGRYTWYKVTPGEPAETFTYNGRMNFVVEFLLDPAQQENVEALQEEFKRKSQ